MKKILILTGCLVGTLSGVWANEFRVANQAEFKKAADIVRPGDEIIIANGNYTAWELSINTNGTADKPIIIRAETPGKVVFSGDVTRPVFQLSGSFTQISGLNFLACSVVKSDRGSGVLIELKASKYCRISNCTFLKNTVKAQFMPIVVISGRGENNRVDHCNFIGNIDNQEVQVKISTDAIPLYSMIITCLKIKIK